MPVVGLLGLAGLWQDRKTWRRLPLHLGALVVAAAAQVGLILAVVGVLYP